MTYRLGWLDSSWAMALEVPGFLPLATAWSDGFTDVVLLGTGGSSRAAEVLHAVMGVRPGRHGSRRSTRATPISCAPSASLRIVARQWTRSKLDGRDALRGRVRQVGAGHEPDVQQAKHATRTLMLRGFSWVAIADRRVGCCCVVRRRRTARKPAASGARAYRDRDLAWRPALRPARRRTGRVAPSRCRWRSVRAPRRSGARPLPEQGRLFPG
jgi:hypothetical protein